MAKVMKTMANTNIAEMTQDQAWDIINLPFEEYDVDNETMVACCQKVLRGNYLLSKAESEPVNVECVLQLIMIMKLSGVDFSHVDD